MNVENSILLVTYHGPIESFLGLDIAISCFSLTRSSLPRSSSSFECPRAMCYERHMSFNLNKLAFKTISCNSNLKSKSYNNPTIIKKLVSPLPSYQHLGLCMDKVHNAEDPKIPEPLHANLP